MGPPPRLGSCRCARADAAVVSSYSRAGALVHADLGNYRAERRRHVSLSHFRVKVHSMERRAGEQILVGSDHGLEEARYAREDEDIADDSKRDPGDGEILREANLARGGESSHSPPPVSDLQTPAVVVARHSLKRYIVVRRANASAREDPALVPDHALEPQKRFLDLGLVVSHILNADGIHSSAMQRLAEEG
eukprot:748128-Hanusia_phi.AAC.6